jgi:hypothetical protein
MPIKYGFEFTEAMSISRGFDVTAAIAATGACIFYFVKKITSAPSVTKANASIIAIVGHQKVEATTKVKSTRRAAGSA